MQRSILSLKSFETLVLAELRLTLNNPHIKIQDLSEWRTDASLEQDVPKDEVVVHLPQTKVWASTLKVLDMRGK